MVSHIENLFFFKKEQMVAHNHNKNMFLKCQYLD